MQFGSYLILFLGPLLGGLLGLIIRYRQEHGIKLFMAFSGAFLFSVTVLSLLPEVYTGDNTYVGIFILAGFFFQIVIEHFSKGIEHGHIHAEGDDHHHGPTKALSMGMLLALCLHSFLEGIPLGANLFEEEKEIQYSLLFGIALHEFPAAFALMTVLKQSPVKRYMLAVYALLYALMSPGGALLSHYLSGYDFLREGFMRNIMAIVIGTFLHISTTILFENSESHTFNRYKLVAIVIGSGIALLTIL